jgi:thiol-disulfide isomerase/thioredoxin
MLKIGDAAPPLQIAKWIKGEPVEFGAKDNKKVFLVEFWATWCPPCIQSIPHLSELQKKYRDKLVIISVSDEEGEMVKRFVDRQGNNMDYAVAVDDRGKTSAAYMMAAGQGGIPTAFIVTSDFRVAWIGSPFAGMDQVLEQVISGQFNVDKAAAEARADEEFFEKKHMALFAAVQAGDWDTAVSIAREVADPNNPNSRELRKSILENVAWLVLTDDPKKPKYFKDALHLSKAALDLTGGQDSSAMDTYALALFENGEVDKAIEFARQALDLAPEPMLRLRIHERLRRYEQAKGSP